MKILGLDIGTTSIGWALVNENENKNENEIIRTGVRVVPLTTDEMVNFKKGKSITTNAERTLKRSMRRNIDRYKQRREHLKKILREAGIINNSTSLTQEKGGLHTLWKLRFLATTEQIDLKVFARILLAINKKRGYKSNRKTKDSEEGEAIDDMTVAKKLLEENLTPGQYGYELLKSGKKHIPAFYRSDLQGEFDKIWQCQKQFYSQLTDKLKDDLKGKDKKQVWGVCKDPLNLKGVKRQGTSQEQKLENYKWRADALKEQLDLEQLVIVFQGINTQINGSSSLLGDISDRSKQLYCKKQTVGQFLYNQIQDNPHIRLKKQVFYRQDYLDEYNTIWKAQAKFYSQLTEELKEKVKSIIFHQRPLKSQKGLLGFCEFENKEIIDKEGKKKTIGSRVIPKSSPLFQEFRIWQLLNNLRFSNTETGTESTIQDIDKDLGIRNALFEELSTKDKISDSQIVKAVFGEQAKGWSSNYSKKGILGNRTNHTFYKAFQEILNLSGHEAKSTNKEIISEIFNVLGINTAILTFDPSLQGEAFETQPAYQLWHLLYSYEGDDSKTGNDKLLKHLKDKFGFDKEYATLLTKITLESMYGSLSAKAIKKILRHLKKGYRYDKACELAGYKHSHYLTKEENKQRILKDKLEILPKNSLRNPVVEKILNQLVNVVNAIIDEYGKPDEIRIELARELKKSTKERAEMTKDISTGTTINESVKEELKKMHPFNTGTRITRNDIIKYKLYQELVPNGYKDIYTDKYIPKEKVFSKDFDIEHIIPKARLFDDSFSNKTLSPRYFNLKKGNKTGIDAVADEYGEKGIERYKDTAKKLFTVGGKTTPKYRKLMTKESEIPDGFIERDLRNTQYVAKKASQLLLKIVENVICTTGRITDKLREDWQLVNIMRELNWNKYDKLGLTEYESNKDGDKIPVIKDWTKRDDHRHHAMDALAIAFTKHNHVQYFNYLNARKDKGHKKHTIIFAIEKKETFINSEGKHLIEPPIPIEAFRREAKKHLEKTLISFKAKNKVVTINKNRVKGAQKPQVVPTPRGQLHKETVYGKSYFYQTKNLKVGTGFNEEIINRVSKKTHREALLKRLREFGNDPKRAFGGENAPSKNPICLDGHQSGKLPEKVKLSWKEEQYTIRKKLSKDLKIDKVIDKGVRNVLEKRLHEFDNDPKKAFVNLDKNPVWLNKEKGISIKSVTITGVKDVIPLHYKKDNHGEELSDKQGHPIPTDFVQTGNNHHVAIYKDEKGNFQEECVSFYEVVMRKKEGLPIVFRKHPKHPDWKFVFTLKQNEMFVFPSEDFDPKEIDLTDEENYHLISPNLFRVQKISTKNYFFRHHLETTVEEKKELEMITYKPQLGLKGIKEIVKVHINHLGKIMTIEEY